MLYEVDVSSDQILTHGELRCRHEIEVGYIPFLSWGTDCEFQVPCSFVLNLATCWPEESSLMLSCQVIKDLSRGCHVSGEVLELITEAAGGPG